MTHDSRAIRSPARPNAAPVLVTGAAGFIGYHVARALLARGEAVIGVDNLNDYYEVSLKEARLAQLRDLAGFSFHRMDVADPALRDLFREVAPPRVVHLAAQAGVRYSIVNPDAYITSNLVGFANILEGCRHGGVTHLVYASSSSVYGNSTQMPFRVSDPVDQPVSLYAATKKANELMAHTYSHLYGLPATGLRFFTVYGPWGRPDMAYFKFTRAILEGRPIEVFNEGRLKRDFTYVDDIVDGVIRVLDRPPAEGAASPAAAVDPSRAAPHRVYNIGNSDPVELNRFIAVLEECLGRPAIRREVPMQPGDVYATYADVADLERDTGFSPSTPIETGLARFVEWFTRYYQDVACTA